MLQLTINVSMQKVAIDSKIRNLYLLISIRYQPNMYAMCIYIH